MDLKGMRTNLLLFKVMKESLSLPFRQMYVVKVDSLFNSESFGEYLRSFPTYLCGTIGFHLSHKYTQLFTKKVQESRHYGCQTHFVCVSFFLIDFEQIYKWKLRGPEILQKNIWQQNL